MKAIYKIRVNILTITKMESPSLAAKLPMVKSASEKVCVSQSVLMR